MRSIAVQLSTMTEATGEAPWAGHEYARGWGVFSLPFDSGHILAFRVVPQNSFAPYRTVWHRDPDGRWSIFVDAPEVGIACPRYFGAACKYTGSAHVDVSWTGLHSLRVRLDQPALDWTLSVHASPALAVLNAISSVLPLATWRPAMLRRVRERMARGLGMGRLRLSGGMPSGHVGTVMPQRMYYVDQAQATLDGVDLGRPCHLDHNPMIGDLPLPARGVMVVGQAMWQIRDPLEFNRTRAEVRTAQTH